MSYTRQNYYTFWSFLGVHWYDHSKKTDKVEHIKSHIVVLDLERSTLVDDLKVILANIYLPTPRKYFNTWIKT